MRTRLFLLLLVGLTAMGAPLEHTKVGNGDDGADLEGAVPLKSGPIVDARGKAVELLRRLRTPSISGLGFLLPEVQRTSLFLAKRDAADGVFARTLPEPHAPTRFFPAALSLDRDQLVALHVHEGLHRALPESIRTDEKIVSEITLAMTTPEATTDAVSAIVRKHLGEGVQDQRSSSLGYGFRQYFSGEVDRLHALRLQLTPFQVQRWTLGLGVEASTMEKSGAFQAGPLTVTPKLHYLSDDGYDIAGWISGSYGKRDVYTIGLSGRKIRGPIYIDLRTGWSFVSNTTPPLQYGSVLHARFGAGIRHGKFELGSYAEAHLADYTRIGMGNFRMLSAGPEIWYVEGPFGLGVNGRVMLTSSGGKTLESLGSLADYGTGNGGLGLDARWSF